MDIKSYVNNKTEDARRYYIETLNRVQRKREGLIGQRYEIENARDLPESTDTLEKLKAANGRKVGIKTNSDGYMEEHNTQELVLTEDCERVLVDGCLSVPLIGHDYVWGIIDAETLDVVYTNPYARESIPMQKARLFGRNAGIKDCNKELEFLNHEEKYATDNYEQTLQALKEIPDITKRGEKLIYPQQKEDWAECVAYRMGDIYHGMELKNAIEVMEALENGKSLEEVKKLISENHSGNSYGMLCNIVREFSKRGVEFARAMSDAYRYSVEHGNAEEVAKWEECFKKIEERNAKFETELSSGTLGE